MPDPLPTILRSAVERHQHVSIARPFVDDGRGDIAPDFWIWMADFRAALRDPLDAAWWPLACDLGYFDRAEGTGAM